jgi:serine/threonine protein phosphatase PrpC
VERDPDGAGQPGRRAFVHRAHALRDARAHCAEEDIPEGGRLKVSLGQHSDRGRKESNQDFHGACVPGGPQLGSKGVAVALADGISSSRVSGTASEVAVKSFLEDYYCTPDAWSVRTSAQRVLAAANSWLHAQTQRSQDRFDRDRGYVCTLSAVVLKGTSAHLFHVGDSRIYRLNGVVLEQLTSDHRVWISEEESHLSRALGAGPYLEIDHLALGVEAGDVFVLATDGVYEFARPADIADTIRRHADNLDLAAQQIVGEAYAQGSTDNLTLQIVRIDELPRTDSAAASQRATELPCAPLLEARMSFEGYRVLREIHASPRSHLYLAVDEGTGAQVVIKIPSIDLRGDPAYLERFLLEEWIAQRVDSPYVLKPCLRKSAARSIHLVMEYIEGQTLAQWMTDHPRPELEAVRRIVEQIAKGLRAFHRQEMLHQDLRPQNIMIDSSGTVKIIDFGSVSVAGVAETRPGESAGVLGTAAYTAPEYFLGEAGSVRSDLFSLGVIAYQMLCGGLPYGTAVAKTRTAAEQRKLAYQPLAGDRRDVPIWVDGALRKALHPDPGRRHAEVSELVYDLRHANAALLGRAHPPLIERNPLAFWKGLALLLAAVVLTMAALWPRH